MDNNRYILGVYIYFASLCLVGWPAATPCFRGSRARLLPLSFCGALYFFIFFEFCPFIFPIFYLSTLSSLALFSFSSPQAHSFSLSREVSAHLLFLSLSAVCQPSRRPADAANRQACHLCWQPPLLLLISPPNS